MTFRSILFQGAEDVVAEQTLTPPDFFTDLNLDQIVGSIIVGFDEYTLEPFFYLPLKDEPAVRYRHEVMQDLENKALYDSIKVFGRRMAAMREQLAQANKLYYDYQKQWWFLKAVETYCEAVERLAGDLGVVELRSQGFIALRDYVTGYSQSQIFTSLLAETRTLFAALSSVRYSVRISGNCVTVRRYESEADYSADVEGTFQKFKLGAVKSYLVKYREYDEMNSVEAKVLEGVARLHPEVFTSLTSFCAKNKDFLDEAIGTFDREVQFYLSYLDFISRFKQSGLSFCYPLVSTRNKEVCSRDGFDLALANKLLAEGETVVCNDFYLQGPERIFVVSGPNQGGKTTFARAFGQLHYLASLGLPVPGREARLFLFDGLFTHFEREEKIENLRGKLEDDLVRIHAILSQSTPRSIIIMNEIFTSTTLQDAVFLSKKIMERVIALDLLCVCVTFMDELASLSEKTVSMVSTVVPDHPATRTYKIVRRPADGLAYTISIAEKYGVTYGALKERIAS